MPARQEAKNFYVRAAFAVPARSGIVRPARGLKVFWFFSSEKNTLFA
jgi:hypothetical protein